jgi:beta-glucosidase
LPLKGRSSAEMKSSSLIALSIALYADQSLSQGYTNESEVPLYGLSPPVYPTRTCRPIQ